jgi:hypothetical protein
MLLSWWSISFCTAACEWSAAQPISELFQPPGCGVFALPDYTLIAKPEQIV